MGAKSLSEQIGDLSPGKLAALAAELSVDHPESARLLLEALGGSRMRAAPEMALEAQASPGAATGPLRLPPPPVPVERGPSALTNRPLTAFGKVPGFSNDLDP